MNLYYHSATYNSFSSVYFILFVQQKDRPSRKTPYKNVLHLYCIVIDDIAGEKTGESLHAKLDRMRDIISVLLPTPVAKNLEKTPNDNEKVSRRELMLNSQQLIQEAYPMPINAGRAGNRQQCLDGIIFCSDITSDYSVKTVCSCNSMECHTSLLLRIHFLS